MSLGNAGRIAACWFVIKNSKTGTVYISTYIFFTGLFWLLVASTLLCCRSDPLRVGDTKAWEYVNACERQTTAITTHPQRTGDSTIRRSSSTLSVSPLHIHQKYPPTFTWLCPRSATPTRPSCSWCRRWRSRWCPIYITAWQTLATRSAYRPATSKRSWVSKVL